jgi:hypothetical protein
MLQDLQKYWDEAFEMTDLIYYVCKHFIHAYLDLDFVKEFSLTGIVDKLQFPDDTFRNFEEICTFYGYKSETHKVVTVDGYINTLHRIYKVDDPSDKPVIVMNHGLIDSSDAWIMNGQ